MSIPLYRNKNVFNSSYFNLSLLGVNNLALSSMRLLEMIMNRADLSRKLCITDSNQSKTRVISIDVDKD